MLEERIARIEAKDEIRELTHRYCHAIVDGDAELIVSLFCEDGRFRLKSLAPQGPEALLEFYVAAASERTYKPFVQNHVIEFEDENNATGRCSVEIRVWKDGQPYTEAGHYHDRYRKVDGRWRFADRHYLRYHHAPWKDGWSKNWTS